MSLLRFLRQPRWIGYLVVALVIAAGFAALGQWQLGRAIQSTIVQNVPAETTKPLTSVLKPQSPVAADITGQLVTAEVTFVPGDYHLLTGRENQNATGYWVVAHATLSQRTADGRPIALAVARGFTTSRSAAEAAIAKLDRQPATEETLTGRLLPDEAPAEPPASGSPFVMNTMSVAALLNLWHGVGDADTYGAYVVEHGTPPAGLQSIYSPPPIVQQSIDWLNIFYAVEWAVFAGFAVYLWYRVARDAWEREREDAEAAAAIPPTTEKVD